MIRRLHRHGTLLGLVGLVGGLLRVDPANAGIQTTTNACYNNLLAAYTDIAITMGGTAAPNPVTLGGTTTLGGSSFEAFIPSTLLIAGYNAGLLVEGVNAIPVLYWVARSAATTVEGQNVMNGSVTALTTISDPDNIPGNGDETATPLHVDLPLGDTVWTPTGGNVEFRQGGSIPTIPAGVVGAGAVTPAGSVFFHASAAGGLIRVNYDCQPGVTNAGNTTMFTPTTALPFETVTVNGPPTAPVCTDESVTVGPGETIAIDLSDNCTDINGNLDLTTLTPTAPTAGTLTLTGPGTFDYDAPVSLPGAPVTFQFTVADTTALVSNTAVVTITVVQSTSKCAAAKYKATGKNVLGKLKCLAKAIKSGKAVDPACLQKAEEKFAVKWKTAEQGDDCLTVGDDASIETKVDGFVTDIMNALQPAAP